MQIQLLHTKALQLKHTEYRVARTCIVMCFVANTPATQKKCYEDVGFYLENVFTINLLKNFEDKLFSFLDGNLFCVQLVNFANNFLFIFPGTFSPVFQQNANFG